MRVSEAKTCGSRVIKKMLTTTRSRPIPPPCETREKTGESERRRNKHSRGEVWGRETYTVRRAAELEGVEVVLHVGRVDSRFLNALLEQDRVVHSLSAREDLFAAHEKVVRVGEFLKEGSR